ncbi:MAG: hypothetical protein ACRDRI_24940 [Pseudonocardiaceae bacterium]
MPTRPPRPESDLPARTVEWLEGRPPVERRFVHSVWERLAELERFESHTAPIDALRSILLDHQPTTRTGHCHGCRRLTWCHRVVWRYHLIPVPRRRHFPASCGPRSASSCWKFPLSAVATAERPTR